MLTDHFPPLKIYATKLCPECDQDMVLNYTGVTRDSFPPIYDLGWYCECGNTDWAGHYRNPIKDYKEKL